MLLGREVDTLDDPDTLGREVDTLEEPTLSTLRSDEVTFVEPVWREVVEPGRVLTVEVPDDAVWRPVPEYLLPGREPVDEASVLQLCRPPPPV